MNLNNNHPDLSQYPQILLTETECSLLLVLLELDVAEINSKLSMEAGLLERISRNGRSIARMKFNLGLLDELSMARALAELDEQYNALLESIRDRALVKGLLLKIRDKLAHSLDSREQSHAA